MAENPNNLQAAENAEPTAEELSEVLRVRREKFAALKEAGRNPFEQTRYDRTAYTQQIAEHFDELDEQMVSIAGRIMSKRSMGKASFFDVADASGRGSCPGREASSQDTGIPLTGLTAACTQRCVPFRRQKTIAVAFGHDTLRDESLLLHSRLCKDGRIIKRHRFLSAFRQANQASLYP